MEKTLDNKGRWRNVIISFRMSPQERDDLNVRVKLSGLTKQDYIIKRLSERDVIVQPNTRVYKALRNQMAEILAELKRINNGADMANKPCIARTFKIFGIIAILRNPHHIQCF